MKFLLALSASTVMSFGLAAAQERADPVTGLLSMLDAAGFENCVDLLKDRRVRDLRLSMGLGGLPKTLSLAEEGHRLKCEALRLRAEMTRLEQQAVKLLVNASILDRQWEVAHELAPEKFPNNPGRDASQVQMRADVEKLRSTANELNASAVALDSEALRVTRLSVAAIGDLSSSQSSTLLAAIKATTQNELVLLLLGVPKPGPTTVSPRPS